MPLRLVLGGLALAAVALGAVGAPGSALLLLLAAVPVATAVALHAVGEVVDHERSRASVIPAALSLLVIVATAATRRPEIALGCLACLMADQLRSVSWARPRAVESP